MNLWHIKLTRELFGEHRIRVNTWNENHIVWKTVHKWLHVNSLIAFIFYCEENSLFFDPHTLLQVFNPLDSKLCFGIMLNQPNCFHVLDELSCDHSVTDFQKLYCSVSKRLFKYFYAKRFFPLRIFLETFSASNRQIYVNSTLTLSTVHIREFYLVFVEAVCSIFAN